MRVAPELTSGVLRNVISVDAGRYGINSRYSPSHVNVYNAKFDAYSQTACVTKCYSSDPLGGTSPSLKYLVRIEPGSFLKGKGYQGADIGANLLYRYGIDGTHYGEANFNTLTTVPLWPWPNEDRIKREMCEQTGVTRGFCQARSLTHYIWEYLGSPMPADLYRPAARATPKNEVSAKPPDTKPGNGLGEDLGKTQ